MFKDSKNCFIIAEVSANHLQEYARAERIIHVAAAAGADAVKLQTYTPDTITIDCDNPHFQIKGTLWEGSTLHDLYAEAYCPWDWQPQLKALADNLGLVLFSTPFDNTAVDFLDAMGVALHKVASFELVDIPLLRKIGGSGKPVILSTGMASLTEITEALETLRMAGAPEIALLKCTSAYPAPVEEANLLTIPHMAQTFGVPVGLSDHTPGIALPIAAVALGARIIEKHLTLSRADGGPDAPFSLEPEEFANMVRAVRDAEKAMGHICYDLTEKQMESAIFRRSLFVVQDVQAGEPFTPENVRSIRPGNGMHTRHLEQVLGKRAVRDIPRGTPLDWDMLS